MANRRPWEPRPLLDENPWSLFPVVGLTRASALFAQVIWIAFALVFVLLRPGEWQSIGLAWLFGAWVVFYITQRFGGREAILVGYVPSITPESSFQERLLGDVLFLFLVLFLAAIIVFGVGTIREFWGSL